MRTQNKNKYRFTMKTPTGKFIACINRRELTFFASGFTCASAAHKAAMLALKSFDERKTLAQMRLRMGHAFGHKRIGNLRFEAQYEKIFLPTPFQNGDCRDTTTRKEICRAIAAAKAETESYYECFGCGAEYSQLVSRCFKCGGYNITLKSRLAMSAQTESESGNGKTRKV